MLATQTMNPTHRKKANPTQLYEDYSARQNPGKESDLRLKP